MSATILYLNTLPGDRTHEMTLAGIRRYAEARGWRAKSIPQQDSRPKNISTLLASHRPVIGCVVECSDDNSLSSPHLFDDIPAVFLHPPPPLRNGSVACVTADNEAIARAAFRELSAGRPAAFAVVETTWMADWSDVRSRTFQALAAEAGIPCLVFPLRKEGEAKRAARLADWVGTLPRKCAVFAVNDDVAAEVAAASRQVGRSIPRELTLLGVDNLPAVCEASHPSITSIQLDHERAGFLAARILAARIMGLPEREMKGRAGHEIWSAACAANEISSSFGDNVATLNSRVARPSFAPSAHTSFGDGPAVATIGPLMAVRRESTRGRGRRETFVLQAVEMIRREACDGLTAASLASRFRCSRWLFEMRFREATGYSVLDEILHVRLERALSLLSQTDTAIGAIYAYCGFRSGRALDSLFHARFKTSMREWRRRNGRVQA